MHTLPLLPPLPLLLLLLLNHASPSHSRNPSPPTPQPVLLSQIKTLTLHSTHHTTSNRLPPIPQLSCVAGPGCAHHTISTLRCTNAGSSYDTEDVEWTCTADLPEEFRLGATEVLCEGFRNSGDREVLRGSCGVEYVLLLTGRGEERFGGAENNDDDDRNWDGVGKGKVVGGVFWVVFFCVAVWIVYGIFFRNREGGRGGGGGWGGGGGDGGGNDDPPPPYSYHPPPSKQKSSTSTSRPGTASRAAAAAAAPLLQGRNHAQQGQNQGWRPGFWTGALGGAAAGWAAGGGRRGGGGQESQQQQRERGMGAGNGEGSSRWGAGGGVGGRNGSGSGSSSSSFGSFGSAGSVTRESTGFGGTTRR